MFELFDDAKWFVILCVGLAIAAAIGFSAYNYSEAKKVDSCVSNGGEWKDAAGTPGVQLGCVRK